MLNGRFRAWSRSAENHLQGRIAIRSDAPRLRITTPVAGSVFYMDPDLPATGLQIPLRANAERLVWSSRSLELREADGERRAIMKPGRHEVTATDPATGTSVTNRIEIRRL